MCSSYKLRTRLDLLTTALWKSMSELIGRPCQCIILSKRILILQANENYAKIIKDTNGRSFWADNFGSVSKQQR